VAAPNAGPTCVKKKKVPRNEVGNAKAVGTKVCAGGMQGNGGKQQIFALTAGGRRAGKC